MPKHTAAVTFIMCIFRAVGPRGLFWEGDMTQQQTEMYNKIFQITFVRMDISALQPHITAWKRWEKWITETGHDPATQYAPSMVVVGQFLNSLKDQGPTAASGVWKQLAWFQMHVGINFHARHRAIHQYRIRAPPLSRDGPPVELKQAAVLSPACIIRLILLFTQSQGPEYYALALVLALIAGCIRFKHAQDSCRTRVSQRFSAWFCKQGKRRVQGHRPGFMWTFPNCVWQKTDILTPITTLHQQLEKLQGTPLQFFFPDITMRRGAITPDSKWSNRPCSLQKMSSIIRYFLGKIGVEASWIPEFSSYSLRRTLPI